MTHREMLDAFNSGQLALGVEPAQARRLFTDHSPNQLAELVGQRLDGQKLFVSSVMTIEHLGFLSSLVLAGFVWRWHALWIIPLTMIAYFISKSGASMGRPGLFFPLVLIVAAAWAARHFRDFGTLFVIWCVLTASLPFWNRLLYRSAAYFVHSLVLRSEYAFDQLKESVLLFHPARTSA